MTTDLPEHILDQAVDWAVKMGSGSVEEEDRSALRAWRMADSMHEQAWQQLECIDQKFGKIPPTLSRIAAQTLERAPVHHQKLKDRRNFIKLLGLGALGMGTGYFTWHRTFTSNPVYTTPTGGQRFIPLADETRILLNTKSGVKVAFSSTRRLIVLQTGEIFIETGKDKDSPSGHRPFWVETDHAMLEALGTSFIVHQMLGETKIHVVKGAVRIHPKGGKNPRTARAGETFLARPGKQPPRKLIVPALDPTAWVNQTIVARQLSLGQFANELSRYHFMPVTCDPRVKNLLISGVFQLEVPHDVARALKALEQTMPVKIMQDARKGFQIQKK